MANRFYMPTAEAQDSSGGVASGYKLTFSETGTSTALDTYSDDALTTANANPVVADSAGRWGAIFLKDQAYRVILSTDADVQIWSEDNVRGSNDNLIDDTINSTLASTGSANAYALTSNRVVTAYASGQTFTFKSNFENTDSATLNITGGQTGASALGAKTIKKYRDQNLAAGDIESSQWVTVIYDGTNFQLVSPIGNQGDPPPRNMLINGDFRIAQRGTSFISTTTPANSDDTVLLDHWVLLSDGNDAVDVTQETTTVPTGAYAAIKLDVETANKKFGIIQFIETKDAAEIIGGVVSLRFKARRTGTTIGHLRAAVIAWSSTADAVTSDVVSAWESAGTNPTLVSNWTYENTPASLADLTTSFQTFTIDGISIDTASTTNVAVFIWADDTVMSAADFLYIADVQLTKSTAAVPFQRRTVAEELLLCQRFYCKTFPFATAPAQNVGNEVGAIHFSIQIAGTAGQGSVFWPFPVTMHKTPGTITYYSPGEASADWWNLESTAQDSGTASSVGAGDVGVTILQPGDANDAVKDKVAIHATADAEM